MAPHQAPAHGKIKIPPESDAQLRFVRSLDKSTDDEIFSSFQGHHPVILEKDIWVFWDKGVAAMPS